MQKLLNIDQAAAFLNLRPKTLYSYICRRRIPFVKIGSRVLFNPEKLEAWVDHCSVDSIQRSIKNDQI